MIKLDDVISEVSRFRDLSIVRMQGYKRMRDFVYPRQEFTFLARELTNCSLTLIGEHINRDHTTVIHSISQVKKRIKKDPEYAQEIDQMRRAIQAKKPIGAVRIMLCKSGPRHTRPQPNATQAQHT